MQLATMVKRAVVNNDQDRLVAELASGSRRFHDLPAELSAREKIELRRRALEQKTGADLGHLGRYSLDDERASSQHCENMIGVIQVPVGVIGPLRIRGEWIDDEEIHVPLATTEGALVASANRGARALTEAGGAVVRVDNVGMTRAPVFRTSGIVQSQEFVRWVDQHRQEICQLTEGDSKHLRLLEVDARAIGTTVFLRFRFDTGDAMGMNMVTLACDKVIKELIEPGTGVECVSLSGNFCTDKKPAAINFQEGRGKRVFAEVVLDQQVLSKIFKTTARALVEVQYRKNLIGSVAAGSLGYNAHYANLLAALFVATGQDPAQVAEAAIGVTCIEQRGPESVVASVYLPDLPLAAIGGGTGLACQRQALDLLHIAVDPARPGAAVGRLAEIVGATVLAGELSLLAALSSRDLARAHATLGRGNPAPG